MLTADTSTFSTEKTEELLGFLDSPLGWGPAEEDLAKAKALIDQGADVNGFKGRRSPVSTACSGWRGRAEIAEYLTSVIGFDFKAVDDEGNGFLATAIGSGVYVGKLKLQNIRQIIENIRDNSGDEAIYYLLNNTDRQGRTLLHGACESGRVDVAEYLISIGANINAVDNSGRSVLMAALSKKDQFGVVGLHKESGALIAKLIDETLDINHKDNAGESALSCACKIGNAPIVDKLFAKGAECSFIDKQGNPPFFYLSKFSMYPDRDGEKIVLAFGGAQKIGVSTLKEIGKGVGRFRLNEFYGQSTSDNLKPIVRKWETAIREQGSKALKGYKKAVVGLIEDDQVSKIISSFIENGYDFAMAGREGKNVLELIDEGFNSKLIAKMTELGISKFLLPNNVPEEFTDQSKFKNIACQDTGCKWGDFIEGVSLAIANRDAALYPKAVKNDDGTVSIFTDAIEGEVTADQEFIYQDYQGNLIRGAQKDFIVEQINYLVDKMGFLTLGGAPAIVFDNSGAVPEIKFNLNPEQLDAIFKQNSQYGGYRGNVSFLSLDEQVRTKDSKIMLMPFFETQEGGIVMSAGCQFTEIPTLQLMKLLPNYESDILPKHQANGFEFHWVPNEVVSAIGLDREDVAKVISKLFAKKGVEFNFEGFEKIPDSFNYSKLPEGIIVDLDEVSRGFYIRYGNCSADVLDSGMIKSLEVDAVDFLEAAKEVVFEKGPHKFKALHLGNIDVMILKERSKNLSSPELVASGVARGGVAAASRLTAGVEFGSSSSPAFRIDSRPPGVVKPIEYKSFDASEVRGMGYVL